MLNLIMQCLVNLIMINLSKQDLFKETHCR